MDWVPMHFWGQEIQKQAEECVRQSEIDFRVADDAV